MQNIKQKAIRELLRNKIKNHKDLTKAKRQMSKKYGISILLNSEILEDLKPLSGSKSHLEAYHIFQKLLRKRAIRTLSGIAPVAVLTKPYPCPGQCVYCPTEKDVPQSYLSNEPAVMRAIRCNYNPYVQVQDRLRALIANGHNPEKIELIVIGGTWSVLPKKYKYWYIANCFKAANDYNSTVILERSASIAIESREKNKRANNGILSLRSRMTMIKKQLGQQQKRNEKTKYKIIGITLETRPDYINEKELLEMRELGCTRVELGVQAIDDKILRQNKRGHGVKEITEATKLLKNFGFKVTYHFMPGLPGSTPAKDFQMYKQLFTDERFQPDQIKFYPTIVTKGSLLYRWWKAGKYKPYTNEQLENLITKCKKITPPYTRIIRLIRDIPGESIMAGNKITNLRQIMKNKGVKCRCIRCREARNQPLTLNNLHLTTFKYKASEGLEYFISYESRDKKILYGFCRLRLNPAAQGSGTLPKDPGTFLSVSAIIRELHVYGELTPVSKKGKIQHTGLGKKLLREAEKIAKTNGHKKIVVISGVGVRDYYRKQGYRLKNTYMVKYKNYTKKFYSHVPHS